VFTKFAHSQSGGNQGYNGSGLGLAICKRYYMNALINSPCERLMDRRIPDDKHQVCEPDGRAHMAGERRRRERLHGDIYRTRNHRRCPWCGRAMPTLTLLVARRWRRLAGREERGMSNLKPRYQRSI
jgi:predicted nucleic acid-binding Zn ribbon protein